jgi:arginase
MRDWLLQQVGRHFTGETSMASTKSNFDMVVSYPQWQGSGRSDNLIRGAQAAAHVCGQFGPLEIVPLAGVGDESGGINRWTAILEQFRSAQAIIDEKQPRRVLTAGETAPATS